jgi:VIT1/CCC1 family predicted Fe2+/Mn2+ transporter
MSRNEILTYHDVSSPKRTTPKGTLRGELLQTLSFFVGAILTGVFTMCLVSRFRLSLPLAFAVSFFSGWTVASLIHRPKKLRLWIAVVAGIALASYLVMRIIGW